MFLYVLYLYMVKAIVVIVIVVFVFLVPLGTIETTSLERDSAYRNTSSAAPPCTALAQHRAPRCALCICSICNRNRVWGSRNKQYSACCEPPRFAIFGIVVIV